MARICCSCKQMFEEKSFYQLKSGLLMYECKSCAKSSTQRYREANRERLRELERKRYAQKDKAKLAAKARQYRRKNKYHCRSWDTEYRKTRILKNLGVQEDYATLCAKANNLCELSGEPETPNKTG